MKSLTQYISESLLVDQVPSDSFTTEQINENLFKKLFGWLKRIFSVDDDDEDKTVPVQISQMSDEERREAREKFGDNFDKPLDEETMKKNLRQFQDDRDKLRSLMRRHDDTLEPYTLVSFTIKPSDLLKSTLNPYSRSKDFKQYVLTDRTSLSDLQKSISVLENGRVQYVNGDTTKKFKCRFYYAVDQDYYIAQSNFEQYPTIHFYNVEIKVADPNDAKDLLRFLDSSKYKGNISASGLQQSMLSAIEQLSQKKD